MTTILSTPRTWTSGESLGQVRVSRLSLYGVRRDPASLDAMDHREFERLIDRARVEWHAAEALRVAKRIGL